MKPPELDLKPIIALLQRDVPESALPYFEATRTLLWEVEKLREEKAVTR